MDNNLSGFLLPHPPVIIPQVGKGAEAKASATVSAMNKVSEMIEEIKPDTVVLISPHAPLYRDYVFIYDSDVLTGDFRSFGSGFKKSFEQDKELRSLIAERLNEENIPAGSLEDESRALDHGAMVPLTYMSSRYDKFKLVALSPSGMSLKRLLRIGEIIAESADDLGRKVVIAASGDMSHKVNSESPYGASQEGGRFDGMIVDILKRGDLGPLAAINPGLREKAAECGYRSLVMLSGAFGGGPVKTEVLSYEAPFGIGYCVASVFPAERKQSVEVAVAKKTLETYVRTGKEPSLDDIRSEINIEGSLLDKPAGVFVSLKKSGGLRGCIGTILPATDCIAKEIIQNAIEAGTNDPRFDPVTEEELDKLKYSVDVLSVPEAASKEELDPEIYGVIVEKGRRRGLLLPDLEGVDTVEEQLRIACMKAGIDPNDKYSIKKFTVTRYK
jgi:AmmeMemoRadiSam system protein A/AmmeMemoRadiSam system protein B